MININYVALGALTFLVFIIMTLGGIDYWKRRVLREKPNVSFMIPCYNDEQSVGETIKSIYSSYDNSSFELIVINDNSTDNSLKVLQMLQKDYGFVLLSNKNNLGKARSLNEISDRAKNDTLFFIDSDVIINRKAVYDVLARLQSDNVKAVSCPYNARNRGFLPLMQEIEYNMLSFLQGAHNLTSTFSLWGGCLAVEKAAFHEAGMFTMNAIIEDMDLALKLNKIGYKVEQSFVPIRTYVPRGYRMWYKQKIRWTSGGAQCFIRYLMVWMKNPLSVFFLFLFSIISIIYIVSLIKGFIFIDNIIDTFHLITTGATKLTNLELTGFYYGAILLRNILSALYFTVFSIPYVLPMIKKTRDIYKLIYLLPFTLVYFPILSIISFIGLFTGIIRYRGLMKSKRAW